MSQNQTKPDFLCVGLPKAGTTSVHQVLDQHADVAMPPVKEVKFLLNKQLGYGSPRIFSMFQRKWPAQQDRAFLFRILKSPTTWLGNSYQRQSVRRYYFGLNGNDKWYCSLFHSDKVSGDITVNYFWLTAEDCRDVARRFPDTKIIILLRSPIDLHWSYFRMIALKKRERDVLEMQKFNEQIEDKKRLIGRYKDLVQRWQEAYSPDQVYVGYFDEMKVNPRGFYKKLCDFIGVAGPEQWSSEMTDALDTVANKSPNMLIPPELAGRIIELSKLNLEGFQDVSPDYYQLWSDEVRAFEARMETQAA